MMPVSDFFFYRENLEDFKLTFLTQKLASLPNPVLTPCLSRVNTDIDRKISAANFRESKSPNSTRVSSLILPTEHCSLCHSLPVHSHSPRS